MIMLKTLPVHRTRLEPYPPMERRPRPPSKCMRRLESVFWGILMALVLLWLATDASIFRSTSFLGVRKPSIQLTGIVAMGCMSLAMVLALRPRWPEAWLGGLDKMYRLH